MGVTIMVWRPYTDPKAYGHVSLVVYHDNNLVSREFQNMESENLGDHRYLKSHVATISWFAQSEGGGSRQPSGQVAPIHDELINYQKQRNYEQKMKEITKKRTEVSKTKGIKSQEYQDLKQEAELLRQRFPMFSRWQKNDWFKDYMKKGFPGREAMKVQNDLRVTRIRPPNDQITIPTLSDAGVHVGLNDVGIIDWWNRFSAEHNKYNMLTRNCASTCAGAVIAGGGASFAKKPRIALAWMPKDVYGWGEKIRDKVVEIEGSFERSKAYLINPPVNPRYLGDLWSLKAWKKESDAGRFSRRYGRLKKIDEALELYHRTGGGMSPPATRNIKLQNLVGIVVLLALLLKERPDTKRKQAVQTLGQQALAKIEFIKTEQRSVDLEKEFRGIVEGYEEEYSAFRSWDQMQSVLKQEAFWAGDDGDSIEADLQRLTEITEQLKYVPGFEPSRFDVDELPGMRPGLLTHQINEDYDGPPPQSVYQPPPLHMGMNPWQN